MDAALNSILTALAAGDTTWHWAAVKALDGAGDFTKFTIIAAHESNPRYARRLVDGAINGAARGGLPQGKWQFSLLDLVWPFGHDAASPAVPPPTPSAQPTEHHRQQSSRKKKTSRRKGH